MKQLFEVSKEHTGAGPVLFQWSPNGTRTFPPIPRAPPCPGTALPPLNNHFKKEFPAAVRFCLGETIHTPPHPPPAPTISPHLPSHLSVSLIPLPLRAPSPLVSPLSIPLIPSPCAPARPIPRRVGHQAAAERVRPQGRAVRRGAPPGEQRNTQHDGVHPDCLGQAKRETCRQGLTAIHARTPSPPHESFLLFSFLSLHLFLPYCNLP